ncbi:hypothetical protein Vadar_022048 [Vaccinium darrowii]|uniref:Uncharacterized protein n=1 Tax=Vaccinium darrowii TaxID=229202 RepID=A0ACB7Y1N0_9ERIC|nr:hypothetical protein Vadar_022048 [Vaccinium darrowii]
MGSLQSSFSLKRDPNFLVLPHFGKRPISRFARLVLFKKIDYLQWVSTVAVFFFFVVLFQIFLPSSFMENSENLGRGEVALGDFMLWKEIGGLDFGEDPSVQRRTSLSLLKL